MEAGWGVVLRLPWLWLVQRLPRSILRGRYPPERIAANFIVDLRSTSAVRLNIHGAVPTFVLIFQYFNLNPFPVRVERIDFDIWFGQPIVEKQVLVRTVVAAHAAHPQVIHDSGVANMQAPPRFEFKLDANAMKYIESQMTERRLNSDVDVNFNVYGSALGVEWSKERQRIQIPRHQVEGQG